MAYKRDKLQLESELAESREKIRELDGSLAKGNKRHRLTEAELDKLFDIKEKHTAGKVRNVMSKIQSFGALDKKMRLFRQWRERFVSLRASPLQQTKLAPTDWSGFVCTISDIFTNVYANSFPKNFKTEGHSYTTFKAQVGELERAAATVLAPFRIFYLK